MLIFGMGIGAILGFGVAQVLVKMLTGVFDPPPERLAIPWPYLSLLAAAAIISTVIAVLAAQANSRRQVLEAMRGL
jgi:putative ABC transport system permease protein